MERATGYRPDGIHQDRARRYARFLAFGETVDWTVTLLTIAGIWGLTYSSHETLFRAG